jgi:hypothetical protein
VLAADLPVLREVGASTVRYVDGDEADAWETALAAEIARLASPESRQLARERALQRAARFTLAAYARGIADVYDRVLAEEDA